MAILIAESKTMLNPTGPVDPDILKAHTPFFQNEANDIAYALSQLGINEIVEKFKMTPTLAQKAVRLAYDFPYKEMSDEAIKLFSGEVFRAIDFPTLSDDVKNKFYNNVRIISSLYGMLRPDDYIKPYRLEFKAPIGHDSSPLTKFWKKKVTILLGKEIKESGDNVILNLLPGDAATCIDFKLIKAFAKVIKPDFRILTKDGIVRNPYTGELKAARGALLTEILEKNTPLDNLTEMESQKFIYAPDLSKPGLPVFITIIK